MDNKKLLHLLKQSVDCMERCENGYPPDGFVIEIAKLSQSEMQWRPVLCGDLPSYAEFASWHFLGMMQFRLVPWDSDFGQVAHEYEEASR